MVALGATRTWTVGNPRWLYAARRVLGWAARCCRNLCTDGSTADEPPVAACRRLCPLTQLHPRTPRRVVYLRTHLGTLNPGFEYLDPVPSAGRSFGVNFLPVNLCSDLHDKLFWILWTENWMIRCFRYFGHRMFLIDDINKCFLGDLTGMLAITKSLRSSACSVGGKNRVQSRDWNCLLAKRLKIRFRELYRYIVL